jgi:hypothetical protein
MSTEEKRCPVSKSALKTLLEITRNPNYFGPKKDIIFDGQDQKIIATDRYILLSVDSELPFKTTRYLDVRRGVHFVDLLNRKAFPYVTKRGVTFVHEGKDDVGILCEFRKNEDKQEDYISSLRDKMYRDPPTLTKLPKKWKESLKPLVMRTFNGDHGVYDLNRFMPADLLENTTLPDRSFYVSTMYLSMLLKFRIPTSIGAKLKEKGEVHYVLLSGKGFKMYLPAYFHTFREVIEPGPVVGET